ncbi:hypothetical protein SUGI_0955640 [Cryptomeria japonica]|uniref:transcription factor bHLH137 isoform X2 n=1 Tax=Cryptomeria japonica TaxID=3369 RepID=UPI0024148A19|nr:transcription factor bHLH137 isoform X2 [Cryptomeria japonica]GLJ45391.1 hypothetical protein SUGI_0955640 [Cryptomeria japonica]
MAAFSVYDQTRMDSDYPLLYFMDELLAEITSGTLSPNLWSEPNSTLWTASNNRCDSFHMLGNNTACPVLDTNGLKHQPRNMQSSWPSQNNEHPFAFDSVPPVLEHNVKEKSQCVEKIAMSITKTSGSENCDGEVLSVHNIETTPSGRAKRKIKQHGNSCVDKKLEDKYKRIKSSKYPQVGYDNKKSEAQLPARIAKKDPSDESCKDYIHVRARRGQATDSHSLAERVRREKITQRMKRLQELVPGCNRVIGKAQMLDEIIKYVTSLQDEVKFLSEKLALASVLHYCSFNAENEGSLFENIYGHSNQL